MLHSENSDYDSAIKAFEQGLTRNRLLYGRYSAAHINMLSLLGNAQYNSGVT
jgi:hypothetical protein